MFEFRAGGRWSPTSSSTISWHLEHKLASLTRATERAERRKQQGERDGWIAEQSRKSSSTTSSSPSSPFRAYWPREGDTSISIFILCMSSWISTRNKPWITIYLYVGYEKFPTFKRNRCGLHMNAGWNLSGGTPDRYSSLSWTYAIHTPFSVILIRVWNRFGRFYAPRLALGVVEIGRTLVWVADFS